MKKASENSGIGTNKSLDSWDKLLAVCLLLILVDGIMTLPNWHLERNPVVLWLGPAGMMIVKMVSGAIFAALWLFCLKGTRYSGIAKTVLGALTAVYGFVVVTNLLVLIS
jgi:hypothetical protein